MRHNKIDSVPVIDGLSKLIMYDLENCASEQYHPGGDPDAMDDTIKFHKERASALRKIREDFENQMSGIIL